MRSRYKITDKNGIYFMTSTIIEWIPVFTHQPYFNTVTQSLTFCRKEKGLQLFGYVILDNHLHLIAAGPDLGRIITDFKKFTARSVIEQLQKDNKAWLLNQLAYYKKQYKITSSHQVWQEGYHPQLVFSSEMLLQKMEYIHNNPVRRGYVSQAEHWLYSSARNYILDDHAIIELDSLPV